MIVHHTIKMVQLMACIEWPACVIQTICSGFFGGRSPYSYLKLQKEGHSLVAELVCVHGQVVTADKGGGYGVA